MYTPLIIGLISFVLVITLLFLERKESLNERMLKYISRLGLSNVATHRLFSTLKGFLLIIFLATILVTILYYSQ